MKSISVSRQYAPLRVCADMCFYFYAVAVLSLSESYTASYEWGVYGVVSNFVAPWSIQLSVLVLVCLAAGFVTVRQDSTVLRLCLSLIPGAVFLTCPSAPILIIHIAAWIYYVICMTAGNFEIFIDVYRRRIRIMLLAALVITGFLIVYHFSNDKWYSTRFFGGELFGLLFFILSVVALRGMRLEFGAPKKMRAMDVAIVVALPALFTASFFLLRGMIPVITFFIKLVTRFLGWLFGILFPEREVPAVFNDEEEPGYSAGEETIDLSADAGQTPVRGPVSGINHRIHIPSDIFLYIFAAALAAVLVYIAIRLIRGRGKERIRQRSAAEHIEKIPRRQLQRRSESAALPFNARQIRKLYKAWLGYFASLNMKVYPSDTSRDLLDRSSKYLKIPENETMRELYIAARYADPAAVTSAQVSEAKRCLSAVRSGKS